MKITIDKQVKITTEEDFDLEKLKVEIVGAIDIESVNLNMYYNEEEFGYGNYNIRTNCAHIYFNKKENDHLESHLENLIENRDIPLRF